MDVFAHTIWTNLVFHAKYHKQRRLRYLAAFFGVVPDLVGFSPMFIYMIFSGRMFSGEQFPFAATNWTFHFASQAYNYTHSLVIFFIVLVVILTVGNIRKRLRDGSEYRFWFFWPILGWPLHILIDLPTHPDFYHTPFLFPLTEYRFTGGVAWSHPVFMAVNYGLMIAAYIGLYINQKKRYGSEK